jgi:pimeloyl-ACP methyl ester carboxylesterase
MVDQRVPGRRSPAIGASRPPLLLLALLLTLVAAAFPGGALAAGTDAPPVPVLRWTDCGGGFQCATAGVPLDYRQPHGRTISLALIRLPASDPAHRIGSLFTNPGGPGGSGVGFVRAAASVLPADVRARFDIVGFDPRGVAASTPVLCFASAAEQQAFFRNAPPFPVGPAEDRAFIRTFEQFARLCAQRNPDLLRHMSTANADRDLDLLRQAVGDARLTYLGLSYGTYLGASYVNLFPDRVRSVILDGVVEPVAWATGRGDQAETLPFSTRLHSDQGAFATLGQFLELCAAAGPTACAFAAGSESATRDKFNDLLHGLLEHPLVLSTPQGPFTLTYAIVVQTVLGVMYSPVLWPALASALQGLEQVAGPEFLALRQALASQAAAAPYNNSLDAFAAISCADSDNPRSPNAWPAAARAADARAPYFGSPWTFASQPCATWAVTDRDRYTGPWNRPTSSPVLVIGNLFDPATRYQSAVALSHELARGRLLTLDGFGHTSFFKSACVERFETSYLVSGQLPPAGTHCQPDQLPFGVTTADRAAAQRSAAAAVGRPLLPGFPSL